MAECPSTSSWLLEYGLEVLEARLLDQGVTLLSDVLLLDDEDMDGELVEALRPVLRGDETKLKALDQAARLEDGSAEQCAALKVIWRSLTPAQKMQTVETSDEDDDEAAALAITTKKVIRDGKARKKTVDAVDAVEIE